MVHLEVLLRLLLTLVLVVSCISLNFVVFNSGMHNIVQLAVTTYTTMFCIAGATAALSADSNRDAIVAVLITWLMIPMPAFALYLILVSETTYRSR